MPLPASFLSTCFLLHYRNEAIRRIAFHGVCLPLLRLCPVLAPSRCPVSVCCPSWEAPAPWKTRGSTLVRATPLLCSWRANAPAHCAQPPTRTPGQKQCVPCSNPSPGSCPAHFCGLHRYFCYSTSYMLVQFLVYMIALFPRLNCENRFLTHFYLLRA